MCRLMITYNSFCTPLRLYEPENMSRNNDWTSSVAERGRSRFQQHFGSMSKFFEKCEKTFKNMHFLVCDRCDANCKKITYWWIRIRSDYSVSVYSNVHATVLWVSLNLLMLPTSHVWQENDYLRAHWDNENPTTIRERKSTMEQHDIQQRQIRIQKRRYFHYRKQFTDVLKSKLRPDVDRITTY